MEAAFSKNIAMIVAQPASVFALAAMVALILAFAYIKKIKINTPMMVHISLMLALTVILHTFRLYHMPQGAV
ncbi:proton-coupled thiamine transporter YuaJ [Pelosinus fermentans DSM 17108]|nr:proton-coupled thiamine transporter YuaJ [Pelosinus fermentans DSM 17108]